MFWNPVLNNNGQVKTILLQQLSHFVIASFFKAFRCEIAFVVSLKLTFIPILIVQLFEGVEKVSFQLLDLG